MCVCMCEFSFFFIDYFHSFRFLSVLVVSCTSTLFTLYGFFFILVFFLLVILVILVRCILIRFFFIVFFFLFFFFLQYRLFPFSSFFSILVIFCASALFTRARFLLYFGLLYSYYFCYSDSSCHAFFITTGICSDLTLFY